MSEEEEKIIICATQARANIDAYAQMALLSGDPAEQRRAGRRLLRISDRVRLWTSGEDEQE